MSRLELDDQILNHPKFIRARRIGGSEAIDLWLGIRAYVGQNLSDGFVPMDMVDDVRGPTGKKRVVGLKALMEVGLVHHVACGRISEPACARCTKAMAGTVPLDGAGYLMHDFHQWSRSRAQVLADRERARERQAKSRGESQGQSRRMSHRDIACDDGDPSSVVTVASASASASARREPPTPSEPARTDSFLRSLSPLRPDVTELHEAYKRTFGLTGHKIQGASDVNAVILGDAIDAHGLATCLAVLAVAPRDRMVNGEADDKGQKHEKIAYIFGNPDTLARLLRAAESVAARPARGAADDEFLAAMEARR